jgi:hypothetical protein
VVGYLFYLMTFYRIFFNLNFDLLFIFVLYLLSHHIEEFWKMVIPISVIKNVSENVLFSFVIKDLLVYSLVLFVTKDVFVYILVLFVIKGKAMVLTS